MTNKSDCPICPICDGTIEAMVAAPKMICSGCGYEYPELTPEEHKEVTKDYKILAEVKVTDCLICKRPCKGDWAIDDNPKMIHAACTWPKHECSTHEQCLECRSRRVEGGPYSRITLDLNQIRVIELGLTDDEWGKWKTAMVGLYKKYAPAITFTDFIYKCLNAHIRAVALKEVLGG